MGASKSREMCSVTEGNEDSSRMLPGWVNARVRHAAGSGDHGADGCEDADTSSVSRRCGLVASVAGDEHGARGVACLADVTASADAVEPSDVAGFQRTCFVF